jgi:hypothetical protein
MGSGMGRGRVPGGGAGGTRAVTSGAALSRQRQKWAGVAIAMHEQGRREGGAPRPRSVHAWAGLKE